jgi:hypothetical protein
MEKFERQAIEAGFTKAQAEFLFRHVAQKPHTHTAEEILVDDEKNTLEEALATYDEQLEALEEATAGLEAEEAEEEIEEEEEEEEVED